MEKLMQGSDQCYGQNGIAPARGGHVSDVKVTGIYGGILRFARGRKTRNRKSARDKKTASRFSEKIMFKQRDEIMIRFGFIES